MIKCEICGKNEAVVHFTELADGKMTEMHLCEACAREKEESIKAHFSLGDFFAGLTDFELPVEPARKERRCKRCGFSYADFKKIGRLGCAECYKTFEEALIPLLRRIHGSAEHVGKSPLKKIPTASIIEEMRRKLKAAVEREEFEKAAELRDEIQRQEKNESK